MVCSKSSSKKDVSSCKSLPQEQEKPQPNFTPKRMRERRTKPKVSRRKEIIWAEINEIQTKKETAEEIRSMKVKAVLWKGKKIDKHLPRKRRERARINKIRNENKLQQHHRNTKDLQRVLWTTTGNLEEINKFLERDNLQEEIGNKNRPFQ